MTAYAQIRNWALRLFGERGPGAVGVLAAAALSQWPAVRAVRRVDVANVVRERAVSTVSFRAFKQTLKCAKLNALLLRRGAAVNECTK